MVKRKMTNNVAVRFSKIWQAKEPSLVLQANILGPLRKTCSKKKMFFIIDARQNSFGITISDKKPDNLTAQASLVNLLRKHSPSFPDRALYLFCYKRIFDH